MLQAATPRRDSVVLRFVFALLVSDSAAGLASGLAGCLAFAATAVLCAFAEIASFDSFDMLHDFTSMNCINKNIISLSVAKVNTIEKNRGINLRLKVTLSREARSSVA